MSHKVEVQADSTGSWAGNQLRFETETEAEGYARNLYARWSMVRQYRVVESGDPVTHRWVNERPEPAKQDT